MAEVYLSIPRDYSRSPAGRYPSDGPFNGQRFREEYLRPKLREAVAANQRLVVDLDGANSYSSSFLEEAFGGIVRTQEFSKALIDRHLEIRSNDPVYASFKRDAQKYIVDAFKLLV